MVVVRRVLGKVLREIIFESIDSFVSYKILRKNPDPE
jgi:hypothetical protein